MAKLTTEEGFKKACRIIQKYYMEQTYQNECVQFYVTHMQPMIKHVEQAVANNNPSKTPTKALPLHDVSFSEDCECDNTEVCGLCFRKKGYEMIDNKLTLTGETEVCDKCEETFTYAGEYRNICFGCEDDFI